MNTQNETSAHSILIRAKNELNSLEMFVNICQNALEIGTRAVKTIQLYQDITAVIEPSELKTENELINAKEKAQKKLKNLLNNKKKMGFHIFLDWR